MNDMRKLMEAVKPLFENPSRTMEKVSKPVKEGSLGIPGTPSWGEKVSRGKKEAKELSSKGYNSNAIAKSLYNQFQSVPKRHFYDFLKDVGVKITDEKLSKDLIKAKEIGQAKKLRQDSHLWSNK